jgi:RNA polymerase sigma factor (sigma-70 family)
MTKEKLRQYKHLEKEILLLEEEIEKLQTSLLAPPKPDGLPKSNYAVDRTANIIAKIVDLKTKLNESLEQLIFIRCEIEDAITKLPADQRLLMRLRYIDGEKWEAIAVEMNYSWKQVHRIHSRALQGIAKEKDDTK